MVQRQLLRQTASVIVETSRAYIELWNIVPSAENGAFLASPYCRIVLRLCVHLCNRIQSSELAPVMNNATGDEVWKVDGFLLVQPMLQAHILLH